MSLKISASNLRHRHHSTTATRCVSHPVHLSNNTTPKPPVAALLTRALKYANTSWCPLNLHICNIKKYRTRAFFCVCSGFLSEEKKIMFCAPDVDRDRATRRGGLAPVRRKHINETEPGGSLVRVCVCWGVHAARHRPVCGPDLQRGKKAKQNLRL